MDPEYHKYMSLLLTLTSPQRHIINHLTEVARHLASTPSTAGVVAAIENRIDRCAPEYKLPCLFLIDSILKNIGCSYVALFSKNIHTTFANAYFLVNGPSKQQFVKVRKLWEGVFSPQVLKAIDDEMTRRLSYTQQAKQAPQGPPPLAQPMAQPMVQGYPHAYPAPYGQQLYTVQQPYIQQQRLLNQPVYNALSYAQSVTQPPVAPHIAAKRPLEAPALNPAAQQLSDLILNLTNTLRSPNLDGATRSSLEQCLAGYLHQYQSLQAQQPHAQSILMYSQQTNQPTPSLVPAIAASTPFEKAARRSGTTNSASSRKTKDRQPSEPSRPAWDQIKLPLTNAAVNKSPIENAYESLYAKYPIQCKSCAIRYGESERVTFQRHMDWHFRKNKLDKECKELKKASSRGWYVNADDWNIYYENDSSTSIAADDPSTSGPSLTSNARDASGFEPDEYADDAKPGRDPLCCPVSQNGEITSSSCEVCGDEFEKVWNDEDEQWHYEGAITKDGRNYHKLCLC